MWHLCLCTHELTGDYCTAVGDCVGWDGGCGVAHGGADVLGGAQTRVAVRQGAVQRLHHKAERGDVARQRHNRVRLPLRVLLVVARVVHTVGVCTRKGQRCGKTRGEKRRAAKSETNRKTWVTGGAASDGAEAVVGSDSDAMWRQVEDKD